jgi:hypothetical protein
MDGEFIMKGGHDHKWTMMEPNIWGTFHALGFELECDPTNEPYRLLFNKAKRKLSRPLVT